jgi:hypothetical protein
MTLALPLRSLGVAAGVAAGDALQRIRCHGGRAPSTIRRQADFHLDPFAFAGKRHREPCLAAGAAGAEVLSKDDGGDAHPHGAQIQFQARFDIADDHVGNLGHGVEHVAIDGLGLHHEHLRRDSAGKRPRAAQAGCPDPISGQADQGHHPFTGWRYGSLRVRLAGRGLEGQHGGENLFGCGANSLCGALWVH